MSDAGTAALGAIASAALAGGGGTTYDGLKRAIVGAAKRDPFDATLVTVFGGAFLFYVAERDVNPKVTSYWDALVFVSTCLSVGYADVFARTPAGKAIAAAVMTVGPAMSGAIFDGGSGAGGEARDDEASARLLAVQEVIVGKLDAIVGELRAARLQNVATPAVGADGPK